MEKILIKNAKAIITCDAKDRVLKNADLLIEGNRITALEENLPTNDAKIIDAKGKFVYPGLVNTHHHMLQAFTRNIPELEFNKGVTLFGWLKYCYELWKKVDATYSYYSALLSMAECLKYGCTTTFNQHFAFPAQRKEHIMDRQFEAAELLGIRYHAGRSGFTLTKKDGGLPPDELGETTDEIIDDCVRLIDKYHQYHPYAMQRIVVAPCSPFSVSSETYAETVKLARDKRVLIHSHLAEDSDEIKFMMERYGKRSLAWAEDVGLIGDDVWYAHGVCFTEEEFTFIGQTKTGISHCPVPFMLLGSKIIDISSILAKGVRLGLGTDGQGVQDGGNFMETLRLTYLAQCLMHNSREKNAPSAYECLKLSTIGGARLLGRNDIGSLEINKGADMFLVDVRHIEYAGSLTDPASFLAKVGYARPVDTTIVNGKIVYQDGRILGINESEVRMEIDKFITKLPLAK